MAKKCLHCGDSMPEEANICLHCLTICNNTSTESDKQTAKRKRKKPTKKQLSILMTIIIFVQAILSLGVMRMDQSVIPTAIPEAEMSDANANASESNPVSKFFKKVLGIEDNTPENTTSGQSPSSQETLSASNAGEADKGASNTTKAGGNHGTVPSNPSASSSGNNTTSSPSSPDPLQPEEDPVLNYNDYEYEPDYDGELKITKYTGNDSCIIIPDQINGIDVGNIESYAFQDNNTLRTVYFKDSENYHILWVKTNSFYNCKNLEKIVFPENTDLGIHSAFAQQCTKLKQLEVNHWQYRFIDGGLYYYTTYWTLNYYCEGYTATTYRIPDWCTDISDSNCFQYNQYVKKFYLNDTTACLLSSKSYPSIEEYIVPSTNNYYTDVDGVLFKKNQNGSLSLYLYPKQKKDKTFTFPANSSNDLQFNRNDYVETLRFPKTATMLTTSNAEHIKSFYKNLKTIYIEKGHPQADIIKYHSNFLGKVIEY